MRDYGQIFSQHGGYEKAIRQFKRVVQLSPDEDAMHFHLTRAFQKLGRDEEARAEYAIARDIQKERSLTVQACMEDVRRVP
jgi:Flp pilus assembly protein TadD